MKTRVACLLLGFLPAVVLAAAEEKKATPLYTNLDLARVAPLRAETGATSAPVGPSAPFVDDTPARERSEAHWRREAERHHRRMAELKVRADELRLRIEDLKRQAVDQRRRGQQGRGRSASQGSARGHSLQSAEARLQALEDQIRETDSEFEDRARRGGVLPGWIR